MNTIFIYGDQYTKEIHAWILSDYITPIRHFHGAWISFTNCINDICYMITTYKPIQIIFEEHSEYEDSVWDAITSKCDNELNIEIKRNGTIIYN